MHRTFIEAIGFTKSWKAMDLTIADLKRLQEQLLDDSDAGDVIPDTGGARKLRFAFEHRGKSGSIRIIYVDMVIKETIYLLLAYPKSKQDNLTAAQKKQFRALIKVLKGE